MSLTLEGVSKTVGRETHMHPTDLALEPGSMTVLLGPTLAGKTTLMRLMAGLDRPNAGRVLWNGKDVTRTPVQKRGVAMVYQQFINYPSQTVWENIASPLRIQGVSGAELDKKVRWAAEIVKLQEAQLRRKPLELSGGQQQRCALARALVKNAGLVLLDEPLANLDYKLREELREEIPKIFEASGAVFVYATTEPTEALLLGGYTACLWQGRVTQYGPTPDVYRQPADAVTARVFSDPPMNFTPIEKRGGEVRFGAESPMPAPDALAALPDGRYRGGFRPNHLQMRRPEQEAVAFGGRIAVTEITGSESFIHVDHGEDRWVALNHGVHAPAIGSEMRVFVDPAHLYVFGEDGALVAGAPYARR